jgi:hypothetical protein
MSMPTTTKKPVIPQPQPQNQSLQMIKSLVQLLYLNDPYGGLGSFRSQLLSGIASSIPNHSPQQQSNAKQAPPQVLAAVQPVPSHFKETESQTKYLSQMWSLVLKSLTAVSVN